ncbi:hypothetical protein BABINDRAFT_6312 [Babjeviella inositovora NRRL Y-12698]|uniref:Phosphoribulokinase/uridine kinase domain-containing protein n=1 Tax=Babjeviella inositovora NRRL Y-12698 TaxID=984486 RepID=A0A1E3QVE3_9ASCO|nr:uncharacterized protein BABINDRAFT_6312 [Babjeviella inositovora NRRL Y-12698]ODQ81635.1 hypothetical protein BABINDRAFT_6312 [Babjeviella inositovora NRRL Y-12698]
MSTIDASLSFLTPIIDDHDFDEKSPLVVGVTGLQGSGKSYLSSKLTTELSTRYPDLNVINISMDDFYLTHADQLKVNAAFPDNPLLQGRGLPGTHDLQLATQIFSDLRTSTDRATVRVPIYDKSKFGGEGDRLSEDQWQVVSSPVDIVIFEGWFNGFQNITQAEVQEKYRGSEFFHSHPEISTRTLDTVNDNLVAYQQFWKMFDCFVLLYSPDLQTVYQWRIQQEHELISTKGRGMSDEEVYKFVNRYMPCYILYYESLHQLGCVATAKRNLNLLLGPSRNVLRSSLV